jgi:protein TonB
LRNKKEGWVRVAFTVTEKGAVANPKVVAAKPRRVFDRSVLQALPKWRFKPKTIGGKPVPTKVTQLIEFKLGTRKE